MLKRRGESDLVTCSGSLILIAGLLMFVNWLAAEPEKKSVVSADKTIVEAKAQLRYGTINGYDSATGSIIDPINVFKNYENRNLGISGKAKHGEKVTILEKSGNGVRIKTGSDVTGWVSSWFVKED